MKRAFSALVTALLLTACAAPPDQGTPQREITAAAGDLALLGCWRAQHRQESFKKGSVRDMNGDCVFEYDATHVRSRCHNPDGDIARSYVYEPTGPGQLHVTTLDPATGKPSGTGTDLRYRIDGGWLITTQQYAASPSAVAELPERAVTLWIRVDPARDGAAACKPHGDTGLRVGRLPPSSLALSVPPGWEPWLVDPATDKQLAAAINTDFFIGAFVPSGTGRSAVRPARFVIVVDDVRNGPSPVREKEFAGVKQRFARELGSAQLTCDLPDRVCAILRLPEATVYAELFNVRGRVAFVHAAVTNPEPGTVDELRSAVKTFVDRLRRDNP